MAGLCTLIESRGILSPCEGVCVCVCVCPLNKRRHTRLGRPAVSFIDGCFDQKTPVHLHLLVDAVAGCLWCRAPAPLKKRKIRWKGMKCDGGGQGRAGCAISGCQIVRVTNLYLGDIQTQESIFPPDFLGTVWIWSHVGWDDVNDAAQSEFARWLIYRQAAACQWRTRWSLFNNFWHVKQIVVQQNIVVSSFLPHKSPHGLQQWSCGPLEGPDLRLGNTMDAEWVRFM